MGHDQLFKAILEKFFKDFLEMSLLEHEGLGYRRG